MARSPDLSRRVAVWLFAVAALVFAMVVVGGATRLTDSGLSITEWKPVTGTVPPLSHKAWTEEFQKYQRIPQYQLVNPGMTLGGFQTIYWWEWSHRMLGRLVGLAFALPFVAFLAAQREQQPAAPDQAAGNASGGLQGVVGWWMVASGLASRVSVAPERLMVHLGLALVVFCLLIWTGLEAWYGPSRPIGQSRLRWGAVGLAALVFLQIMLGGLVAGNHAGLIYNDWPLMNGEVFPGDYLGSGGGILHALLHSQAAVQFNHRIGAYILIVCAAIAVTAGLKSRRLPVGARLSALIFAGLVLLQACLGVATLMLRAPLGLALAHQCLAAAVLASALVFAWRARRA